MPEITAFALMALKFSYDIQAPQSPLSPAESLKATGLLGKAGGAPTSRPCFAMLHCHHFSLFCTRDRKLCL